MFDIQTKDKLTSETLSCFEIEMGDAPWRPSPIPRGSPLEGYCCAWSSSFWESGKQHHSSYHLQLYRYTLQ